MDSYDECPLILPNGEKCRNTSHSSPKIKPFCHYMHRDDHVRQQNKLFEEKVVAGCAIVGELVDNQGRICLVTHVNTAEKRNEKKQKGHKYKSGQFESTWITACGEKVEYPKGISAPSITCIGCMAAFTDVRPIHCLKCAAHGVAIPANCPHR